MFQKRQDISNAIQVLSKCLDDVANLDELAEELGLQLCKENKKILLLVDNCSAHADVPLKQIQMMFLPPNTTSLIQPCDMGIIRALKAYARHEIRCRIIEKIDDSVQGDTKTANEIANEISVLDAMHILGESYQWAWAWAKATAKCIQKC